MSASPRSPDSPIPGPPSAASPPPTRVRVDLHPDGDRAILRVPYMGDDPERLRAYQAAVAGARYDRATRGNVAPLDRLPAILRRLREDVPGLFAIDPLPSALRDLLLKGAHFARWHDVREVKARIAHLDEQIRERQRKKGEDPRGLRPYQVPASIWLAGRTSALLADDPRSGKTLMTLAALPTRVPVVVVCPTAPKHEWLSEIRRWRPNLDGKVLEGRSSFRWPRPGEVVVLNYDILPDVHDREGKQGRKCHGFLEPELCPGCRRRTINDGFGVREVPDGHLPACDGFLKPKPCPGCAPLLDDCPEGVVLVLDEIHKCKHLDSLRGARCLALGRTARAKGGRTWGLSGTPLENKPPELYNVLSILGCEDEAFGSFWDFVRIMGGVHNGKNRGFSWTNPPLPEAKDRIRRVMLRRTREEIWPHLPPKIHRTIEVPISARTIAECDRFLEGARMTADHVARLIAQDEEKVKVAGLSQIMTALAAAKIPALMERLDEHEEAGEPVLVFSVHRAPLDAIAKRPGWGVITGDVKDKKVVADLFQAGKLYGVGVQTEAGGTGLRMDRAIEVIHVDDDYRPSVNVQCQDRAIGYDDKRGLMVTRLVANHPLDRRKTEILLEKERLITATVDAAQERADGPLAGLGGAEALEDELRREGQAIAPGSKVRRPALGPEEDRALEVLRGCELASYSDERLANRLCDEAERIGLSDAQWRLAIDLAGRRKKGEERCSDSTKSA